MSEEVQFYLNPIATPMAADSLNKKLLRLTKKRTLKNIKI